MADEQITVDLTVQAENIEDINKVASGLQNVADVAESSGRNMSRGSTHIRNFINGFNDINNQVNQASRRLRNSLDGFHNVWVSGLQNTVGEIKNFTKEAIDSYTQLTQAQAKVTGAMAPDYNLRTTSGQRRFTQDANKLKQQSIDIARTGVNGRGSFYNATQVASAQEALVKAGVKPKEIIDKNTLRDTLTFAQANDLDIETAVNFATALGSQFNVKKEGWGEMLDKVSHAADLSIIDVKDVVESMKYAGGITAGLNRPIDEVLAEVTALGQFGLKGSQSGSAIQALYTRLLTQDTTVFTEAQAKVSPPKAVKAFYDFSKYAKSDGSGLTYKQIKNADSYDSLGKLSKNLRPMDEIVDELDNVMSELNDEEQAWFAKKFFGLYQMKGAYALVNGDDNELKKYQKDIKDNSKGTNETKLQELQDSDYGKQESLEKMIEATKTDLGGRLSPLVNNVREQLYNVLSDPQNYEFDFNELKDALRDASDEISEQYGDQIGNFVNNMGDSVIDLVQVGGKLAPDIGNGILDILTAIGNLDIGGIFDAWDKMTGNMDTSVEGLPDELKELGSAVSNVIKAFGILVGVDVGSRVTEFITSAIKGIMTIAQMVVRAGTVIIQGGVDKKIAEARENAKPTWKETETTKTRTSSDGSKSTTTTTKHQDLMTGETTTSTKTSKVTTEKEKKDKESKPLETRRKRANNREDIETEVSRRDDTVYKATDVSTVPHKDINRKRDGSDSPVGQIHYVKNAENGSNVTVVGSEVSEAEAREEIKKALNDSNEKAKQNLLDSKEIANKPVNVDIPAPMPNTTLRNDTPESKDIDSKYGYTGVVRDKNIEETITEDKQKEKVKTKKVVRFNTDGTKQIIEVPDKTRVVPDPIGEAHNEMNAISQEYKQKKKLYRHTYGKDGEEQNGDEYAKEYNRRRHEIFDSLDETYDYAISHGMDTSDIDEMYNEGWDELDNGMKQWREDMLQQLDNEKAERLSQIGQDKDGDSEEQKLQNKYKRQYIETRDTKQMKSMREKFFDEWYALNDIDTTRGDNGHVDIDDIINERKKIANGNKKTVGMMKDYDGIDINKYRNEHPNEDWWDWNSVPDDVYHKEQLSTDGKARSHRQLADDHNRAIAARLREADIDAKNKADYAKLYEKYGLGDNEISIVNEYADKSSKLKNNSIMATKETIANNKNAEALRESANSALNDGIKKNAEAVTTTVKNISNDMTEAVADTVSNITDNTISDVTGNIADGVTEGISESMLNIGENVDIPIQNDDTQQTKKRHTNIGEDTRTVTRDDSSEVDERKIEHDTELSNLSKLGYVVGGASALYGMYNLATADDEYTWQDKNDKVLQGTIDMATPGLGAGIGAVVGSIVPGIGTAIGAGIGAGIGGAVSFIFGSDLSESINDWIDGSAKIEDALNSSASAYANYEQSITKADKFDTLKKKYEEVRDKMDGVVEGSEKYKKYQEEMRDILAELNEIYPGYIASNSNNLDTIDRSVEATSRMVEMEQKLADIRNAQAVSELADSAPEAIDQYNKSKEVRSEAEKNATGAINNFNNIGALQQMIESGALSAGYDSAGTGFKVTFDKDIDWSQFGIDNVKDTKSAKKWLKQVSYDNGYGDGKGKKFIASSSDEESWVQRMWQGLTGYKYYNRGLADKEEVEGRYDSDSRIDKGAPLQKFYSGEYGKVFSEAQERLAEANTDVLSKQLGYQQMLDQAVANIEGLINDDGTIRDKNGYELGGINLNKLINEGKKTDMNLDYSGAQQSLAKLEQLLGKDVDNNGGINVFKGKHSDEYIYKYVTQLTDEMLKSVEKFKGVRRKILELGIDDDELDKSISGGKKNRDSDMKTLRNYLINLNKTKVREQESEAIGKKKDNNALSNEAYIEQINKGIGDIVKSVNDFSITDESRINITPTTTPISVQPIINLTANIDKDGNVTLSKSQSAALFNAITQYNIKKSRQYSKKK